MEQATQELYARLLADNSYNFNPIQETIKLIQYYVKSQSLSSFPDYKRVDELLYVLASAPTPELIGPTISALRTCIYIKSKLKAWHPVRDAIFTLLKSENPISAEARMFGLINLES